MNISIIKSFFCFTLMVALLILAFVTDEPTNRQLFASLGVVAGSLVIKFISH